MTFSTCVYVQCMVLKVDSWGAQFVNLCTYFYDRTFLLVGYEVLCMETNASNSRNMDTQWSRANTIQIHALLCLRYSNCFP